MNKTQTQENVKLKEKLKTQGKTQNSREKSQNSRRKLKDSANFALTRLKIIMHKCIIMCVNGKLIMLSENGFFLKSAILM